MLLLDLCMVVCRDKLYDEATAANSRAVPVLLSPEVFQLLWQVTSDQSGTPCWKQTLWWCLRRCCFLLFLVWHAGTFPSASAPGSCSGDGQLWRPCRKLKGRLQLALRISLRVSQKGDTSVEQKEKWERKREWTKKVKPAAWQHLVFTTHAQTRVRVWPQSNAQFAFTGISEMFCQGCFFLFSCRGFELSCPRLFVPLKHIWGVVRADNKGPPLLILSSPEGLESTLRPHQAFRHTPTGLHRCNFKRALTEGGWTPAVSSLMLPAPQRSFFSWEFKVRVFFCCIWCQKNLRFFCSSFYSIYHDEAGGNELCVFRSCIFVGVRGFYLNCEQN